MEGASGHNGRMMKELDSESDLDHMTEVWSPVPPAMREAPAAELGAGPQGCGKQPTDTIGLPREGQFRSHQRQQ